MKDRILELDVGNSFCKWRIRCVHGVEGIAGEEAVIEAQGKLETSAVTDGNTFKEQLKSKRVSRVWVCSVAKSGVTRTISQYAMELWGIEARFFKVASSIAALQNSYHDPLKMGADRWLASIAARNKFIENDICIVDCGSAINIEFISSAGVHTGGYIVPGLHMMRKSLVDNAAQIALEKSEQLCSIERGLNTYDNVFNGTFYTVIALVEKLLKEMVDKRGVIILTGGDAQYIQGHIVSSAIHYLPDLVLDGFAYIDQSDSWY